jgi:hypothetical protein
LIMAIKRLTIELDDDPDMDRPTAAPSTLMPREEVLPARMSTTDTPMRQAEYQEAESIRLLETSTTRDIVGRTPTDLIFAYINRPEFTACAFLIVSYLITKPKNKVLHDFLITFGFWMCLNIVWFGIRAISKCFARKKSGRRFKSKQ